MEDTDPLELSLRQGDIIEVSDTGGPSFAALDAEGKKGSEELSFSSSPSH